MREVNEWLAGFMDPDYWPIVLGGTAVLAIYAVVVPLVLRWADKREKARLAAELADAVERSFKRGLEMQRRRRDVAEEKG